MTWRRSKSPRECSGINRRDTVSCFVIHKYGNGKQRLLVAAAPCASSPVTQSQRVHTKERRTINSLAVAGKWGNSASAAQTGTAKAERHDPSNKRYSPEPAPLNIPRARVLREVT